jgi:hypothetical protein
VRRTLNIPQIITALAAFLAILWTLVQIVAYAREKDPRNIKIALLLTILIVIAAFLYPTLKKKLPVELGVVTPHITGGPAASTTATSTVEPLRSGSPVAVSTPVQIPPALPTTPYSSPSPVTPSEASAAPVSQVSSSPTPQEGKRGELKSSFITSIRRNMLGGVSAVGARCTFAETGGEDVEIISYTLIVHYLESPGDSENKAVTRSFERTLKDRITVSGGSTVEKKLEFDSEIGDLIIKSKKSGPVGWIKISWSARDRVGNSLSSESVANKPE